MHRTSFHPRYAAIALAGLIFISGCKAFSLTPPAALKPPREPRDRLALKQPPSTKRKPATLDSLAGGPPTRPKVTRPPAGDPEQTDLADRSSGINLDDVSLSRQAAHHIEADDSIEAVEERSKQQLPGFIESAVHPFGEIESPYVLTDQVPRDFAPSNGKGNGKGRVAAGARPVRDEPAAASAQPTAMAAREMDNRTSPDAESGAHSEESGETGEPALLRIVADSGAETQTEMSSSVASLFESQNPGNLSGDEDEPVPAPAGDVRLVSHEQPIEETPDAALPPVDSPTAASLLERESSLKQVTWDEQLTAAIHQLDKQVQGGPDNSSIEQQVKLHLLKMVAGEAVPSELKLSGADEHRQRFWQHQLKALSVLLETPPQEELTTAARVAQRRRRATLATEQLELASNQLANHSTLRLQQCAFCTEVLGFGQYTAARAPFVAGQQILIYCEIENYSLRKQNAGQDDQFVAELQGLYSIVDASNRVVYQYEYQPIQDTSQRRRKDFYMFFPVTLPDLADGSYRLQLSIEDLVGNKVASSKKDLAFEISSPAERPGGRADRTAGQVNPPVPVYRNR